MCSVKESIEDFEVWIGFGECVTLTRVIVYLRCESCLQRCSAGFLTRQGFLLLKLKSRVIATSLPNTATFVFSFDHEHEGSGYCYVSTEQCHVRNSVMVS